MSDKSIDILLFTISAMIITAIILNIAIEHYIDEPVCIDLTRLHQDGRGC